jgi:TolB protein
VHTLATGQRMAVANFKGSNSAPAWSPDGKQLAVALTRDGVSQIYLLGIDGSNLRRLTQSSAIDTEPAFSPDGRSIFFTSDRGGTPQIYRIAVGGGDPARVTFNGTYNVSPRVSPDGRSLAYVSRRDGKFSVALRDLAGGAERVLTDTGNDESPSFSPNSKWVLYTAQAGGRDALMAVTTDGRVKQRLTSPAGEIREPAWGPFIR